MILGASTGDSVVREIGAGVKSQATDGDEEVVPGVGLM